MINSHTKLRYQRLPAQQSIRVFEAAARHLNFTLAAEELAMTQSGISKQIKALESFLNTSLFIRKGQKIYLTDMGRLFYDRCVEALDCLQHAVDEIQGQTGQLRLQAPPTFACRWLIPRMEQLHNSLPKLSLHIETTWLRSIHDHIQAETNQLVIHACINYPFNNLHAELLRKESLFVMVSPSYMARHGDIDCAKDLVGKTLIHTRVDGHIHWEAWAKAMGEEALDTSKGYEFETLDMALSAAENGLGVLVCDLLFALNALRNGRLVIPFKMPIVTGLRYLLLRHLNSSYQPLQQNYRQWLQQQIHQDNQDMAAYLTELGFDNQDQRKGI
ncbi:LysR family transcriptional regulator [Photobacterium kishitanii]|uniref:LysR substrate-binding domain-containing protein n=1 Tax=Photobacterium kishitanii TaxID=318456 RepID=UPI000D151DA8|nr:LysR substrate-binding domain-containing protein [Photobacterium kishitanii]PSU89447.1 LysR family transcriptional regulator [Photobacterium kishitanii]